MRLIVLGAVVFLSAGCSSWVQKIVPGEPITKERCEKIDTHQLGYRDGSEGQRNGDKYEFWYKNCAALGVKLDKPKYDEGYKEGLATYCSCEEGFASGVRDTIGELRGQMYMCDKPERDRYYKGHAEGKNHIKDEALSKPKTQFEREYFDDKIKEQAGVFCKTI